MPTIYPTRTRWVRRRVPPRPGVGLKVHVFPTDHTFLLVFPAGILQPTLYDPDFPQ